MSTVRATSRHPAGLLPAGCLQDARKLPRLYGPIFEGGERIAPPHKCCTIPEKCYRIPE